LRRNLNQRGAANACLAERLSEVRRKLDGPLALPGSALPGFALPQSLRLH